MACLLTKRPDTKAVRFQILGFPSSEESLSSGEGDLFCLCKILTDQVSEGVCRFSNIFQVWNSISL